MAKAKKQPFDVSDFLSKMDDGRTLQTFRKTEKFFAQADRPLFGLAKPCRSHYVPAGLFAAQSISAEDPFSPPTATEGRTGA